MKKIVFIVPLVALIVLSGCPSIFPEDLSDFKDCTGDDACIRNALLNCEKAFSTSEEGDESLTMHMKFTIYGIVQDNCKMKFKIEEVETNASTEEEQAMMSFIVPLLQGQEMTCMVPPDKLGSIEEVEMDSMMEYCSGTVIDVMKQFQQWE